MRDLVEKALGTPVESIETLAGGFQHQTCLVTLRGGDRVVGRTGGHDAMIEAAVMRVAGEVVPVPPIIHTSPEIMILGYVQSAVLSNIVTTGRATHELGAQVGRTVARIGDVGFDHPGFFHDPTLAIKEEAPWSQQLGPVAESCMAACPDDRLDVATRKAWAQLCARTAPELEAVDHQSLLVHADINPKNILIAADGTVAAVIDWEFAYSGCPLGDAANMLRFSADYPPEFTAGFREGFGLTAAGERLGVILDMFALSDLVTRPAGNPVAELAAARIRSMAATW